MQFDQLWRNISIWLQENAPEVYSSLGVPASDKAIDDIQRRLSMELPEDLKKMYQLHNGQNEGSLFFGLHYLAVVDCFNFRQGMFVESGDNIVDWNNHSRVDREIEISDESLLSKIPFAVGQNMDVLCVDTLPSKHGSFGQVVFIDSELNRATKISDSIAHMLAEFSVDLLSGRYLVDADRLDPSKEIYIQLGFTE